jgi:hypothetical protein
MIMIDILFYLPQIIAIFCAVWFIQVWLRCFRCCSSFFKTSFALTKSLFDIFGAFCFLFIDIAKKTITYVGEHSAVCIHA